MRNHSPLNLFVLQYGCIVSCSSDGAVKVWSQKGTEITTLYGHTQRVNGCDMIVKTSKDDTEEEEDGKYINATDCPSLVII